MSILALALILIAACVIEASPLLALGLVAAAGACVRIAECIKNAVPALPTPERQDVVASLHDPSRADFIISSALYFVKEDFD